MEYFTSDEHLGHKNIILPEYSNRIATGPFATIEENDAIIISRHNERVKADDTVIHCGDFTLKHKYEQAYFYIKQLNGHHIFLRGSHDSWLDGQPDVHERWERKIGDIYIVADHYPGRSWPRSHYGSIQVHGHHHASMKPIGRQYDVGVDNNKFYPVSLEELKTKIDWNASVQASH